MKILYAAPASPHPKNFGGSMRTAIVLAALERAGSVDLVVAGDEPGAEARAHLAERRATLWATAPESPPARALRIAGALATWRSIPSARLAGGRLGARLRERVLSSRPDVVVLGDSFLGEAAASLAGTGAKLVIDTHNLESELARSIASVSRPLRRAAFALLAANVAHLERRVLPLADAVWTTGEEDAAWYRTTLRLADVAVVPNAIEPADALPPPAPGADAILLSGLFAYAPNEDAAMVLLGVSRELRRRGVEHEVLLAGRAPSARLRAAAAAERRVTVTGEVASIEPWLARAAVVAAPLRAGSGTKYKLLQAMLAGRPVVTTPVGASGLALEHGRHALVVDVAGFADATASLLADAALRERLAAAAREHVLRNFSPAVVERAVAGSLARLARGGAAARRGG